MAERRYDEHTETTLARAAAKLPIPQIELEHAARRLIEAWTDPANPDNWLKRPAKRTCARCGRTWKTRIALLACPLYCSPECREASKRLFEELLEEMTGYGR